MEGSFLETHPLFDKVRDRIKTAKIVSSWLSEKEGDLKIKTGNMVSYREMAIRIREGLASGEIFFVVKKTDEIKEKYKARSVRVLLPKVQQMTPSGVREVTPYGIAVALSVRSDLDIKDLRGEEGDNLLSLLYSYDKNLSFEQGRFFIDTKEVKIKDPDFGRFPDSKLI